MIVQMIGQARAMREHVAHPNLGIDLMRDGRGA